MMEEHDQPTPRVGRMTTGESRRRRSSRRKTCWGRKKFLGFGRCQRGKRIGPWCSECIWQGLLLLVILIALVMLLPNERWRVIAAPFLPPEPKPVETSGTEEAGGGYWQPSPSPESSGSDENTPSEPDAPEIVPLRPGL